MAIRWALVLAKLAGKYVGGGTRMPSTPASAHQRAISTTSRVELPPQPGTTTVSVPFVSSSTAVITR